MLPKGWRTVQLKEILARCADPVAVVAASDYREIGIRSHGKGIFHKPPVSGEELGNKRVFHVVPNALILNIVFAWEQAIAVTSKREIGTIASHRFPMYLPKDDKCDVEYLRQFFCTPRGKELLRLSSPGGAGRNKTLGQSVFEELRLEMPPILEQHRVVKVLGTWDRAICTVESLLTNTEVARKLAARTLMRQQSHWCRLAFRDAYIVSNQKEAQISASEYQSTGVIPIVDQGKRFIAGFTDDVGQLVTPPVIVFGDHTRIVKWVDFPFRPGADGTQLLRAKTEKLNPKFAYHLLANAELPNLGYSRHMGALRDCVFYAPPTHEEQIQIANRLDLYDAEILCLSKMVDALRVEKSTLATQLLTGKRRVRLPAAELES